MGFVSSKMSSCWTWSIGQPLERHVERRRLTLLTRFGVERAPHSGGALSTRPCWRSITRRIGGREDEVAMLGGNDLGRLEVRGREADL